MAAGWQRVPLGATGLTACPLGLGSSYGIGASDVEHAFDKGINWYYWGSLRRGSFGDGLSRVARAHRDDVRVVVQSYSRVALLLPLSVESALRRLRLDHADVLLLGMWNDPIPPRILDAARALKERGRVRHVFVSCHRRATFARHLAEPLVDGIMARYNAAHPGAEQEVFPLIDTARSAPGVGGPLPAPGVGGPLPAPGVVAYTATCWGRLLDPALIAGRERVPRASDCYRFALSHPAVNVVLAGPRDRAELDEAMAALDRGPLDPDEIAWMRRVGALVKTRRAESRL